MNAFSKFWAAKHFAKKVKNEYFLKVYLYSPATWNLQPRSAGQAL